MNPPVGIRWTPSSKSDVRKMDRDSAIRLLRALGNFLQTYQGDVKKLEDVVPIQYRLRVGDYRIRYREVQNDIEIISVKHRRDAYR